MAITMTDFRKLQLSLITSMTPTFNFTFCLNI